MKTEKLLKSLFLRPLLKRAGTVVVLRGHPSHAKV